MIIDKGDNNRIENIPNSQEFELEIYGDNNHLDFTSTTIFNSKFVVKGDNNEVLIGRDSHFSGQFFINGHKNKFEYGERSRTNSRLFINMSENNNKLIIGKDCLFADTRFRTSDSHHIIDLESQKRLNHPGNILIRDHVWIAEGVLVLKNSIIEQNCIIGARSLVSNVTLPKNHLCVGSPCKPIRSNVTWR